MKLNSYKWKKEELKNKLYRIHINAAQEWGKTWHIILDSINQEPEKKYKTIEMKLQTLIRTQIKQSENTNSFYFPFINKTAIKLTCYALTLLNGSLKYKLSLQQKNWIKSLALEDVNYLHMNNTIYATK